MYSRPIGQNLCGHGWLPENLANVTFNWAALGHLVGTSGKDNTLDCQQCKPTFYIYTPSLASEGPLGLFFHSLSQIVSCLCEQQAMPPTGFPIPRASGIFNQLASPSDGCPLPSPSPQWPISIHVTQMSVTLLSHFPV